MAKITNLSDLIIKKFENSTDVKLVNTFADISDYISTGNYLLNAQLSGSLLGGIPNNRITTLAGDSGTGKTYLALNICREAQRNGYFIVYVDTEAAVSKDIMMDFGIDTDTSKLLYAGISNIEDFGLLGNNIIQISKDQRAKGETPKILIILDSQGMLNSKKEIDDLNKGKNASDMGTRAKELRKLYRNITYEFSNNGITFIPLNHTYCLTSGHNIQMGDNSLKDIKDIQIGEYVKTLEGNKEVINTFNFENLELIELTLSDNTVVKCTKDHKFLVSSNNELIWKNADELNENDEILSI